MKLNQDISRFDAAWQAANGKLDPFALSLFEERRKLLSPQQVAQLDQPFRSKAYRAPVRAASRVVSWIAKSGPVDWGVQFSRNPSLGLLVIHAADGRLRARAVRVAPMEDTAALTALLLRRNDWAAKVRKAAFSRLEAVLPKLSQEELVPLCLFVLDRVARWERGGAVVAQMLAAYRDWPLVVKATFMETATGPLGGSLRQLLRSPDYDWALPDLALCAQSVFVRAVAVETLLTGHARWTEGSDWVWHDKVFNQRQKVPRREKRAVEVSSDTRAMVLRHAGQDKSAKLRSLAADYLITVGAPEGDGLVMSLTNDKAKSVQWRMTYYHKKWVGNLSAQES
ncbi:hypothetical protein [uncultured Litoreibacter sp.]|uniref:hypothetical protein n=1 Tax=uncultured Litoreibacter sp. TaxID=1392394 RepID=UPI0026338FED|nr:hypothetical protein [uncultured Litoreibacter sp.]